MTRRPTLDFLKTETASGLFLIIAAFAAMIAANSDYNDAYWAFVHQPFTIQFGDFAQTKPFQKWVKDGLMAVFFYVVGLEIKYEVLKGELSSARKLALPLIAALGGMIGPALVYAAINLAPGGVLRGWPIPTATDIAFAIAILALAGRGLPGSLRLFLLTLAIVDDLGAVALIGILFTGTIQMGALTGAGLGLLGLALLGRWARAPLAFHLVGFLVVWAFTLKSGINTSLAGVACAMLVPIAPQKAGQEGMLKLFMHSLHPYVAYGILPLFAFTAAGFTLEGLNLRDVLAPLPLGIAAGLFFGKQVAVLSCIALAVKSGLARKPTGATWLELYGISVLCGIGFTMSLFIGGLAFAAGDALIQTQIRLGVVVGSVASTALAFAVLNFAAQKRRQSGEMVQDET
ncbi:MAG: Na+/H+ antiporter NhaA [Pseudomonadota bacterium]|jgi:NhaA family Na+:H+ antiporter